MNVFLVVFTVVLLWFYTADDVLRWWSYLLSISSILSYRGQISHTSLYCEPANCTWKAEMITIYMSRLWFTLQIHSSLIVILCLNLLLLNCWYTQITKRHILYITADFWLYLPRFLPSFWYNRGELNIILFIESVLCMIGLFHSHIGVNNKN